MSRQVFDSVLCALIDATSIDLCGGKAVALGRCLRAGICVPDGLVLTTAALRSHLNSVIDKDEIEQSIRQAPMEALLFDALQTIYNWAAGRGFEGLVVRSSAPIEDSQQQSFAGQFRSIFVQVRPDTIESAVREVWASALDVATLKGTSIPLRMAVIVQVAVRPRRSGVAFAELTRNQIGIQSIHIEATLGLAVPLVNGMVSPDVAKFSSSNKSEFKFTSGSKTICALPATIEETQRLPGDYIDLSMPEGRVPVKLLFVDTEQHLIWLRIPPSQVTCSCLDQLLATKVTTAIDDLVKLYKHDLDVEWAEDETGKLWIVQARPMTAPLPKGQLHAPAGTLSGLGVSSGSAQGSAYLLRTTAGVSSVPPGAVLVCGAAKPEYMPAIARSVAIVSADGGMLCHMAIVARELGKPCVVGIHDALERFIDGEKLYVDGDAGFIRKLTGTNEEMPNEVPCPQIVQRCTETLIGVTPPSISKDNSASGNPIVLLATTSVARDFNYLLHCTHEVLGILIPTKQACDELYLEPLRSRMFDRPVTYGDNFEIRWLGTEEVPDIDISAELQSLQTPSKE